MAETKTCPKCGAELPGNAPAGICPACLMQAGLDSEQDGGSGPEMKPTTLTSGFVPPEPEDLAEHFPQLEILELLGKGGMGAVYKARQPGLDRLVAVKIPPQEVGADPAFAERFTREARALAKLSHQNIVHIYDFGRNDEFFYFIMEYVEVETKYIQRETIEEERHVKVTVFPFQPDRDALAKRFWRQMDAVLDDEQRAKAKGLLPINSLFPFGGDRTKVFDISLGGTDGTATVVDLAEGMEEKRDSASWVIALRHTRLWKSPDPPPAPNIVYLDGHTDIVRAIAASPDGKHLVSAGEDGRVIIRPRTKPAWWGRPRTCDICALPPVGTASSCWRRVVGTSLGGTRQSRRSVSATARLVDSGCPELPRSRACSCATTTGRSRTLPQTRGQR